MRTVADREPLDRPPAASKVSMNGAGAPARPVSRRRPASSLPPTLWELEAAFRGQGNAETQAAIMERLRQAGNAALPTLEAALRQPSPELRRAAARGLRAIGTTEAVRLLLKALREETDPSLRQEFQGLFQGWEAPPVAQAFVAALRECPDEQARAATAALLGPLLGGGVAEALLGEFSRPGAGDPFRQAVAETFSQTRSQAAAEALAAWLRTDGAAGGVQQFASAAAKIGTHAVISSMLDAYRRVGNQGNLDAFLTAFAETANPEAASAFAEVLADQSDPNNAWRIASAALGSTGTPLAVEVLVKEIRNAAPGSERLSLMLADLTRVRNPQALDSLVQAYSASQGNPALARATAQALLNLGESPLLKHFGEQSGRQWLETLHAAIAQAQ